jgi:2-isopropylmalate synthase
MPKNSTSQISIFDTTLRDGEQGEGVSFTVGDKLKIARLLDELGVDYIEGGWPASNPKAIDFFKEVKKEKLKHAKMVAFGSTMHPKNSKAADDANLQALVEVGTPTICIFGKSWDIHAKEALGISLEKNLELIADSVKFLKNPAPSKKREVIFDAEHFFDGYKSNPEYALKVLQTAKRGRCRLCGVVRYQRWNAAL